MDLRLVPEGDLGAPVEALGAEAGAAGHQELASLRRREADQRLRTEMAAEDFAGPLYQRLEDELIRYGLGVLRRWMSTGYIFQLAHTKGLGVHPTDAELQELRQNEDLRTELADITVARTLPRFKERALVGGGWKFEKGASLTTYFMGATVYVFVNEFRCYRRERRNQRRAENAAMTRVAVAVGDDPAMIIAHASVIQEALARLEPRTAVIVGLHLEGFSHQEITQKVGLSSDRVVEGVLRRWRVEERRRAGEKAVVLSGEVPGV